MNDEIGKKFSDEIDNLIEELMSSGNSRDKEVACKIKRLRSNQKSIEDNLFELLNSLDYLRVAVKYILFDLEATRRENGYLKELLDGKGGEL